MPLPDLCPADRSRFGADGNHGPGPAFAKEHCGEGCSHSVKISQRSLPEALLVLQRADLAPKRIFITAGAGSYQEVEL